MTLPLTRKLKKAGERLLCNTESTVNFLACQDLCCMVNCQLYFQQHLKQTVTQQWHTHLARDSRPHSLYPVSAFETQSVFLARKTPGRDTHVAAASWLTQSGLGEEKKGGKEIGRIKPETQEGNSYCDVASTGWRKGSEAQQGDTLSSYKGAQVSIDGPHVQTVTLFDMTTGWVNFLYGVGSKASILQKLLRRHSLNMHQTGSKGFAYLQYWWVYINNAQNIGSMSI